MNRRILNTDTLTSHGHMRGRRDMATILEAGLQAADPYNNTRDLVRCDKGRLIIGGNDFLPVGSPQTGDAVFDLAAVGRILVVGAGKGVQRIALAIEEALGDRLSGGHVIAKHGDERILSRIGVTFGGHPTPDEGCVEGCRCIVDVLHGLRREDLVITIGCNGISSLLTLPPPELTIEDVAEVTRIMQIERGAPTDELNPVRNHLDVLKSGRSCRLIRPATAIHLMGIAPTTYDWCMHHNLWQHFLPDHTTFADAVAMLKKWDAWDAVSESVRCHLLRADPRYETVKAPEFEAAAPFRVFGVMPRSRGMIPTAMRKAAELGYTPVKLATFLRAEASQAGLVVADMALTSEREGQPFTPPCAMFSSGEILVTVGDQNGVGGRNQEYCLSAATRIAGSRQIVMGAVDSDGTDGPGGGFAGDATAQGITCLAGGIVDGATMGRARELGVDVAGALKVHAASSALWCLQSGVVATHNISVNDLAVTLVMGRTPWPERLTDGVLVW